MEPTDLTRLSDADPADLVTQLHTANEQLRGSAADLSRLSVALRDVLAPEAAAGSAQALQAIGQFLTVEHSYEDLAALVQQQAVDVFGMDGGVLFLVDHDGRVAPVTLPPDPLLAERTARAAHQAIDTQSIVSQAGRTGETACVALPLARHGHDVGAMVLYQLAEGEPAIAAEAWAALTIYTGMLGAICAGMRQAEALRRDAYLLEALLAERARQVQNSRDVLRIVFDHLPEGVLLLSDDNSVLAANRFFSERIAGTHPRDVVGRSYAALWADLEHRRTAILEAETNDGRRLVRITEAGGRTHIYEVERVVTVGDPDAPRLEFWRDYER